jgi:hypothetical protein
LHSRFERFRRGAAILGASAPISRIKKILQISSVRSLSCQHVVTQMQKRAFVNYYARRRFPLLTSEKQITIRVPTSRAKGLTGGRFEGEHHETQLVRG